jgi:hypothetical protein
MLIKRTPSLADCGLPQFTFAGFSFPRYVGTLPTETLAQRFANRARRGMIGDYYHAPTPNNTDGRGFYLDGTRAYGLRFDYCDEIEGARIHHEGWYVDDDCSDVIRGIVLRLPHDRGFLSGWTMGQGMASAVDYAPIHDNAIDAAYAADESARIVAECEREYRAQCDAENETEGVE